MAVDAFLLSAENAARVTDGLKDRTLTNMLGHVADGGLPAAIEYYNERPTPEILMVELEGDTNGIMAGLDDLAEIVDPGTRVIVAGSVNDVSLYRSLLKLGISDYLASPLATRQIVDSIYTLTADPEARPRGRVIAVTGVHGGAGGSSVAQNLAYAITSEYDTDVAILDFDMQLGTAALNLNVEARQGIFDCLSQTDRLDDQLLDRYIQKYDDHLSILGTSGSLNLPQDVDVAAMEQLVDIMSQRVPFVVLDLPSRWSDWISQALIMADETVIVATPDLVSLRDVQNWLRHLNEKRGDQRHARIVLNKVGRAKKSELSEKDFEGATEGPVFGVVPHDPVVFDTASN
ncbi:MAG: AAA family ATPase, partial [Alphaproteobacteria bacterium]|nr:AAA family ATPase [Alphaproteobacteria bacterium]